jgi:hypothetical protein
MRLRGAVSWLIAPALLVAVASVQFQRVAQHDQSSWRGVGFGMFATFDDATNRLVAATVVLDGDAVTAHVPADLHDDVEGLLVVPAAGDVQAVADELLQRRWVVDPASGAAREAGEGEDGRPATSATVEVRRVEVTGGDDPVADLTTIRRASADGGDR